MNRPHSLRNKNGLKPPAKNRRGLLSLAALFIVTGAEYLEEIFKALQRGAHRHKKADDRTRAELLKAPKITL